MNKDIKFKELIESSFKGITPKYVEKSSIIVLNQKCIRNNVINYSLAQYHSDDKAVPENKFLKVGDILINSTGQGTAGRCAFVKELPENKLVTIDSHILVIRMSDFYTAGFAGYHLYNIEKLLQTFMDGSTGQGEFDKQRLYNVFARLPSENSRKSIYELLSEIDEKIALNNQINATLEQMAKTLYDYWFVQFDFPDDNGKPYKSSGGEMVYNETLKRDIPKGWEVKEIQDFCRIFTWKKDVNQASEMGQYKFFSCAPNFKYSNEKLFEGKAILVSGNGSYTGRTIFVNDAFDLYQRTYAVVSKTDLDVLEYIFYSMLRSFVPKVSGGTHGSAIPYIVFNDIAKETILFHENVVDRFMHIIINIQKQVIDLSEQNYKLTEMRDWLLPMLMNGQVTITGE